MYIRKIKYATNTTETTPSSRCNIPNFLGTLHVQVAVVVDDLSGFSDLSHFGGQLRMPNISR